MKLLLVDGHYYVYRSFFAIQNLSNSRGEPTNAIFGFTKTLRLMIKHLQPELGAVFWDEGTMTDMIEVITKGEAPDMPAFGGRLSEEEILAIAHHIKANFRPRPATGR